MKLNYNFPKIRFCQRGHAIVGDNLLVVLNGDRRIRCRTCSRQPHRHSGNLTEPTVRKIVGLLNDGATFNMLDGRSGDHKSLPKVIAGNVLSRFIKANPKLGAWMKKKSAENGRVRFLAAMAARRQKITAPTVIRGANEAMHLISRAVPRSFLRRDEIISLMALAYVEGQLKLTDIVQAVDIYRRRADRQAEDRLVKGRYGNNSIDAQAYRDSPVPIIETISQGMWQ